MRALALLAGLALLVASPPTIQTVNGAGNADGVYVRWFGP